MLFVGFSEVYFVISEIQVPVACIVKMMKKKNFTDHTSAVVLILLLIKRKIAPDEFNLKFLLVTKKQKKQQKHTH